VRDPRCAKLLLKLAAAENRSKGISSEGRNEDSALQYNGMETLGQRLTFPSPLLSRISFESPRRLVFGMPLSANDLWSDHSMLSYGPRFCASIRIADCRQPSCFCIQVKFFFLLVLDFFLCLFRLIAATIPSVSGGSVLDRKSWRVYREKN
jgi:hypothetical protein